METSAIQLVPFGDLPAHELGERLHSLIYGACETPDPWIATDFPQMVRLYKTAGMAAARVQWLAQAARNSGGERGSLAVVYQDSVMGAVTFAQQTLTQVRGMWPFRSAKVVANGPLLACWLARPHRRQSAAGGLLPQVIRTTARLLAFNGALRGRPWTLVRTDRDDNGYVSNCLLDTNNGFGGFLVEARGEFPHVDGVEHRKRKLYVARCEIETLRS